MMAETMHLSRAEYGRIYHQVFGKAASREACQEGWRRWQNVFAENPAIVLHPRDTPVPTHHASDYWIFATTGPLRFLARVNEAQLSELPEMWLAFSRTEAGAKLLAAGGGQDDRERARDFVHKTLVDGFVLDPNIGPAIATAIAWLLSTNRHGLELKHCHQFGYDISYVPVTGEFNFHAVLKWVAQTEGMFDTVRALPLPEWRPPLH